MMDELDKYFKSCDRVASSMWPEKKSAIKYCDSLFEKKDSEFLNLVQIRRSFLDDNDYNMNGGLLRLGFFNGASAKDRLASVCLSNDITTSLMKLDFEKRFESYKKSHAIFNKESTLWKQIRKSSGKAKLDSELIRLDALEHESNSEIFKFNNTYFKSDLDLNPVIIEWVKKNFPKEKTFLRIDPNESYSEKPPQRLYESILQPANPNWWKELMIRPRKHEGAAYILDDCEPNENYHQYWEKHVKKVERLEIKANRGPDNLLSILIEEVTKIDGHGLMKNRVIHMDTKASHGTKFKDATLAHLDIAIYVYKDKNAQKRFNTNINKGIRADNADYKCHLIRVEDINFKSLFGFSNLFLKSKTLFYEWVTDQFENYNPKED